MGAYRLSLQRSRRFRSPYRRRGGRGAAAVIAIGAAALSLGARAHAGHAPRPGRQTAPATAAAVGGQAEFYAAVLADLGAPDTAADVSSLEAWQTREQPWPSPAAWNPLDSTLAEPGSWNYNTFGGDLHVQSYPTAAGGIQATAATLGGYPLITAALRSGEGICGGGFAGEFLLWSGGGYSEVC